MTPEGLDAIRADHEKFCAHCDGGYGVACPAALADALEQAWAEGCTCGTPHYCQAELDAMLPKYRDDWLEMKRRAERAEAQCVALRNEVDSADRRAERAEAELAFQRKWCLDNLRLIPPTRAQHADLMRALDEIEGDPQ